MGLDIYLEWDGCTDEDRQAQYKANDPEQYGVAGYLQSSYNDAGFNSWARRHLHGKDLYWIFDCPGEDGPGWQTFGKDGYGDDDRGFVPDWQASRARALEVVALVKTVPPFSVVNISTPYTAHDPGKVLDAFLEQHQRWEGDNPSSFDWYSSREGMFFQRDRPRVLAVMWQTERFGRSGMEPVLICEGNHDWYRRFACSVVDFIDLAQTKPNPRMSWSG